MSAHCFVFPTFTTYLLNHAEIALTTDLAHCGELVATCHHSLDQHIYRVRVCLLYYHFVILLYHPIKE